MLKNLKSIFIVEEETPQKKVPKAAPKGVADTKKEAVVSKTTPRDGKITQKFTDILLKAMENANLDGFDYLEYKKSLKSLQKMNMAEATAYQSAFAMAQTMGATPAHLVQTAEHYLQALKEEEQKFEKALENQRESRVGNKRNEQKSLQQTIVDKELQIKKLQEEIKSHQAALAKLDKEINASVGSIENTKNDFFASYQNLVQQIQADVEKMKIHLK